ncbi:MAG: cysteine desulfurase [Candidatus Parvibacillus calidus]|nr:MAG: cysteine desulfurase [Candidatus Parvibacillus calidus]WKZ63713.1 MAG: cysteine desulfurase family protein [Saprospiraceae bacterium]
MDRIYLDNAATTPLDPEVLDIMCKTLQNDFGNPSSTHSEGRKARALIEAARKSIASCIHASPSEIIFTSGGTESNNMALKCAVRDLHVKRIISSRLEHHCVSHTLTYLQRNHGTEVILLDNDEYGRIDLIQLEEYLANSPDKKLVSLMHANNEIGTVADIEAIGNLCRQYDALFHSDTVQTVGHFPLDVSKINIHFLTGTGHKIHGPKGSGFLYIRSGHILEPLIDGGSQEKNLRGGTENLHGIIGLAKSVELAVNHLPERRTYITGIKNYFIEQLKQHIQEVDFNGDLSEDSLYTVLNVSFPAHPKNEMLLLHLDIHGVSVSGGSACSSGADRGSHVIEALDKDPMRKAVRFSFSHHNTFEEVDKVVRMIRSIYYGKT